MLHSSGKTLRVSGLKEVSCRDGKWWSGGGELSVLPETVQLLVTTRSRNDLKERGRGQTQAEV